MNDASVHQLEERIFDEALAVSVADRPTLLARACGQDDALRHRIEDLLRGHDVARNALDRAAREEGKALMAGLPENERTNR